MHSIQIRVEEGNKEALLEALGGQRKTIDFDFRVAYKQREADQETNRQAKEENRVGSQEESSTQKRRPPQLSSNRVMRKKANQRQRRSLPN